MLKLFFILLLSLSLQAQGIAEIWESSAEYESYNRAIESGDVKQALKIKKTKVSSITAVVLKEYLADFKPKYQKIYLEKINKNLPIQYKQMLYEIHKKLSPLLVDKSLKGRNKFVQSLYNTLVRIYDEKGNAKKYLVKLEKNVKFTDTKVSKDTLAILKQMASDSDTEAAKSPEQKRKENEEWFRKKQQEIDKDRQEIDKDRQEIDKDRQEIDKDRQEIDKDRQEIDKWNKIIKKLNSL